MARRSKKKKHPQETGQVREGEAKEQEIPPGKSSPLPWSTIVWALVIAASALWIYWPALHGGWFWDDELLVSENTMVHDPSGLWKIWFQPGSQVDYQPIKVSMVWLQWRLWGDDTLGYHLTNVFLHILASLLVWRLLSKFGLPLAWLGGLIFAVHPVQVESVAWITELKNTLSLPPFLLAMCAWIDYEERGKRRDYLLALGLFVAAMLCKLSVVLFPLVILLYAWWRRGRIGWNDLKISAPFFAVSLLLGMITIGSGIWDHRFNHTDPDAMPMGGFLARLIAAGLSFSFCFSKSFLPVGLLPIYPKWLIDPSSPVQFLPWLILGAVLCWFWIKRQDWGRHALLGLGFFLINLGPCPGFIPAPDMAYTWVMDHFLYLPIIGLIGLVVAALGQMEIRLPASFRPCGAGLVIMVLGLLAFQSRSYAKLFINSTTMWTYTLDHNPESWLAHNDLGDVLSQAGRVPEAITQYRQALSIKPDFAEAYNNLGLALQQTGHLPEAMKQYDQALRIKPDYATAHYNLGGALLQAGRLPEAIAQFNQALQINPRDAETHYNLGNAMQQAGRSAEAIEQFEQALRLKPDFAEAHNYLGLALFQTGRVTDAREQFEQALCLKPDFVEAHNNLGLALLQTGQGLKAIKEFEQALLLKPDYPEARYNLANALLQTGQLPEAIQQYEEALQLKTNYAEAHNNLGVVLFKLGRVSEAAAQFQQALRIKPDYIDARDNLTRMEILQKTAPTKK